MEEPQAAPALPTLEQLFPATLPLDVGDLPDGIASHSAQACSACHYAASDQWAEGTHSGPFTAFLKTVDEMDMPACASCHLPLVQQHTADVVYDQDDATRAIERPYATVDFTLRSEGVTCATCHTRDGHVVAADENREAPHPMVVSNALSDVRACSSCHQMTLPNATTPLYNTVGEWQATPWAEAGIGCVDCHMGSAADGGLDHGFAGQHGKGLSVLVRADATEVVRGGDPIDITLTLQNTGAGHSLPTGSPFQNWVVHAWLEGPSRGRNSEPDRVSDYSTMLARTLGEAPDYPVVQDTRLAAFEQRELTWPASLDVEAKQGDWFVVVELRETIGESPAPSALRTWRFPLTVR